MILSYYSEPELSNIKDLNTNNLYEKIKIKGVITQIKEYDDFTIIKINDKSNSMNVLINNINLNLSKNESITIIGKISEYKNDLEIIAQKIYLN